MEAALRDIDRRKDEFVTMLAHELRNPLAPVIAAAELLASGKLESDSAKKASQVIIRQVKHMTELIDDLLDMSRVSRGQITLKIAPVDMNIVVDNAVEQVRSLIENRRHKLVILKTFDTACVKGDNKRLVQVVANLLNNAAKYTPPGGTISVEVFVTNSDVCIEVADDGIGIDPAIHESIFNLFEQAKSAAENSLGGLGIGLALVRNLTQLHGGGVLCQSEGLGHGSRFTIRIPRLAPSDAFPSKSTTDHVLTLPVAIANWKPTDCRRDYRAPPQ